MDKARVVSGDIDYDLNSQMELTQTETGRLRVEIAGESSGAPVALLTDAAATGDGVAWAGGTAAFELWGTTDGAAVALEKLTGDGSTYIALDGAAFAADEIGLITNIPLPAGTYRAAISGAGGSTSLSATLTRIG